VRASGVVSHSTIADAAPEALVAPAVRGNIISRGVASISATWALGPASLVNLNAYAFGLSGLFTGIGSGVLPFKVLDIVEDGKVHVLWMDLDQNGAIAFVSLCGLLMAAVAQPFSGYLSDRSISRWGQRVPLMVLGAVALALAALSLGTSQAFGAVLASTMAVQMSGNFMQGPANALLIDNIPPSKMGGAAGMLNLYKVIGAGSLVVMIFLLMDSYDRETGRVWLWASLLLATAAMVASTSWTVLSLRPRPKGAKRPAFQSVDAPPPERGAVPTASVRGRRKSYVWFLVSLAFVIAAMSAMQVYAIPFLKNAVGLENPARGAALLALVVAGSTSLVTFPAGKLQDRFGHRKLLAVGGLFGAGGALALMTASSLGEVMAVGVLVGVSIGIFVSVTWAMANRLVAKPLAARQLGYTSIATLVGAATARLAGPGIDALNERSPELGYTVMLGAIAIAFVISPFLLGVISPARRPSPAI